MASSFTVTADLKLDPRSINASAKQVKLALGRITGQASEFQKSLDASTARVFAFGATTTVLAGISTAFRSLVKSTIEVEKRLVEINAIFQQSQAVMNNFRDAIFKVAQTTGQTFATVADAAGELARQGLSAEETAKRLKDALILTRISGLGAEDSVKTLTAAINGFTSAALTATQVTSKIVAVDTAFAVSAQDLAQGLARAGSTAEDAGVSFDELLGLITAVEQRTARGGAVIGNAFKSIFTRLSRGSTIDDLKSLGVEIDASQTGVQKLQALSNALQNIADPTVASQIKELAGGVFQINVVSATLKDLANDTGVFKKATQEAAQASDDAYKRNEQLNKSISAQINSLVAGITNLSEKIGSVTFGPILTNLIGVASKITETFNNLLDPEQGSTVAKAFFKGIGSFISGPGLVLITTAFVKIVRLVAKFALDGFKAVLQIGNASEKVKQIEGGIVQLLAQDDNLRKVIASTTATQAQKEAAVINAIKTENSLLLQQETLVRSIANLAARKGVTGFSSGGGFTTKGAKRFSGGYVPNFARSDFQLEEAEARALGASSSVRAKMSKGKIGGKKFIMNSQETELPNFGRNGDSAVIPSYAKGYVPNFANFRLRGFGRFSGAQLGSRFGKGDKKFDAAAIAAGYKSTKQKKQKRIENGPVNVRKIAGGLLPTILTPNPRDGGKITTTKKGTETLRPLVFDFPVKGFGRKKNLDIGRKFEKDFNAESLTQKAKQKALSYANSITNVLGSPKPATTKINDVDAIKGFTGAVRSAAGAIFDAALTTALNIKGGPQGEGKSAKGGDFDIRGRTAGLEKFFAGRVLPTRGAFSGLADFKFSAQGSTESMKKKTLSELVTKPAIYNKIRKAPLSNRGVGKAAGYIPNFAGGGDALSQAISREKAAGLPEHKIRINQSNRLINSKNPTGLAITNTRDEPRGLRDVFASGYIPNFASPSGGFAGFDQRTVSAQKINELEKQLESNAKANQQASKSTKNSSSGFDALAKETKSANKFLKLQGIAFASSFAVSGINVKVTEAANKERQKQVDVINKSLEAEKKNIEASNKSAEAKLKAIEAADKAAAAQIKTVENNKTAGEKAGSLAETITSVGLSLLTLKELGGGKALKGLGKGLGKVAAPINKAGANVLGIGRKPKTIPLAGKAKQTLLKRTTVRIAASQFGKQFVAIAGSKFAGVLVGGLGAVFATGASLFGAALAGWQIGKVLDDLDKNPIRVLLGQEQKSKAEETDRKSAKADNFQQERGGRTADLKSIIASVNKDAAKGIKLGTVERTEQRPIETTILQDFENLFKQIGTLGLAEGTIGGTEFETVKTRELDTNFDVSGAYKEQLAKQGINLPEIDSKKVDAAFATYSKAVDKAGSDFARDKIDEGAKQKIIEKETKLLQKRLKLLENGGTGKLQGDIAAALANQAKNAVLISSKYQEISKTSQAISDNQYLIANASKIAASRISAYANLVPDEFQEFAAAKALTSNIGLDINQRQRDLSGAKSARDTAAVAARGQPAGSDEAVALKEAEAEVSKQKVQLTQAAFDAQASILGSLKDTAEKIKSLGGPAFQEAFKSVEEAQRQLLLKPSADTQKTLADAFARFKEIEIPKEIKLRQDANTIAGSGALLGSVTQAQTGVPDIASAVLGLKELKGTKAGSKEREDQLAKLEPLLSAIKDQLGPEIFAQVLQTSGVDKDKFVGAQKRTAKDAFRRNLKDQGGLDEGSINKLTELYGKTLEDKVKQAEKFPNPEGLNQEFDNLQNSTTVLNGKLTELSEGFPSAKDLSSAIGALSDKAKGAADSFDALSLIGQQIGGFASGVETAIGGAVGNVESLKKTNEEAQKGVESLKGAQDKIVQKIAKLQKDLLDLTDKLN